MTKPPAKQPPTKRAPAKKAKPPAKKAPQKRAKTTAVAKRPRGAPSIYTPAIAEEILRRISSGETLSAICRDAHMPSADVVWDWSREECRPKAVPATFPHDFARARMRGHDAIAAEALHIANTPFEGVETVTKPNGDVEERRGDMLGHRKLQIETRLKLLAKWDKRYADKMAIGGDPDAPPIQTASTVTLDPGEAYLRMIGKA